MVIVERVKVIYDGKEVWGYLYRRLAKYVKVVKVKDGKKA